MGVWARKTWTDEWRRTDGCWQVGITSLGHREHLIAAIQELRASRGIERGAAAADSEAGRRAAAANFEAALMAQRANDKNPPRRIMLAENGDATRELPVKWTSIQRSAWDQRGRDVDVYVRALVIPWEQRAMLLDARVSL